MKLRQIVKQKLALRLAMVAGVAGIIALTTIVTLVIINLGDDTKTRASENGKEDGVNNIDLNSGEILSKFEWEQNPVTLATIGPNAISVGKSACSAAGGRSSSLGLNPGASGADIDLVLKGTSYFDVDGIDISVDFKRKESSGYFFVRGNSLQFGFDKGYITIAYRIENGKGGYETVQAKTDYFIPIDEMFRTFRFIYNPRTGRGEVFVSSIIIWNNENLKNRKLYWKNSGDIVIGKEIDGGGYNIPVLDNLVIRTTGSSMPLSESLLNFIAEPRANEVCLRWSIESDFNIDNFVVQRSINGVDFNDIGSLNVGVAQPEEEYMYIDKRPAEGITFYRLKQIFTDGKFVTHPVTAVKITSNPKDIVFDHISPDPFKDKLDVAYYAPENGKVWLQITDTQGKILCSEFFGAVKGKNVHVFTDRQNLPGGTYILNLVFNDKRVKTKIIKG